MQDIHGRRRAARRTRRAATAATTLATAAALTACSVLGGDGADPGGSDATGDAGGGTVVLLTHNSFSVPDELVERFEAETGYTLQTRAPGDGGALVNQLVLTKDAPLGDVVFGIDNTFATRAIEEGVLEPYAAPGAVAACRRP